MSGHNRKISTPAPFNIFHQPHQQYNQLQFEKYTQKLRDDQQIKSPNEKIDILTSNSKIKSHKWPIKEYKSSIQILPNKKWQKEQISES
jgi:hypothetical protein